MKNILEKLFLKKSYQDTEFTKYITKKNIHRTQIFSLVIILFEALLLIGTYIDPSFFSAEHIDSLKIHYILMIIIASLLVVVIQLYKRKILVDLHIINAAFGLALLLGLGWSSSISLIDSNITGSISVYLTFIFILSVLVLYRPDYYLVFYLLIQIVFVYNLPLFKASAEIVAANQVNSTVFVIFAWFVSRYQYQSEYEKYTKDLEIAKSNEILKRKTIELSRISMIDSLTGMLNRHSLDDVLSRIWTQNYIQRTKMTVIMADIDQFKQFNDTFGHVKGDECLVRVCGILNEITKEYCGHAFRYGGDEFCLAFEQLDDVEKLTAKIRNRIKDESFNINNSIIKISMSIGYYNEIPNGNDEYWKCIEIADSKLYENKRSRKLRITDRLAT